MKKTLFILSLAAALLLSGCGAGAERQGGHTLSATDGVSVRSEEKVTSAETGAETSPDTEQGAGSGEIRGGTDPGGKPEEQGEKPKERKAEQPSPADDALVKVRKYIPDIFVDLKYATEDNFTKTVIYDFSEAYLRYGTVKKLKRVQKEIKQDGYFLKIWDAYRPVSAQFKLWEVCPDERYVANPNTGHSSHSRGNTVDITLSDRTGNDVEMPTGFDHFSAKADRDYSDCTETEREHAIYLEEHMVACGFEPYTGEWWHFADVVDYPVAERLPRKSSK